MQVKAKIYSVLNEAERLKHATDKWRNYEYFSKELWEACKPMNKNKDLYDSSIENLKKILGV